MAEFLGGAGPAPQPDPIERLGDWIEAALRAGEGPIRMALATASKDASPSVRIVLVRGLDQRGLRFYTSYFSRKGRELAANPRVAAAMHWPLLEWQVRIEGVATLLSEEESDAYFSSRPRGHQLAAWASEQSEPIESRAELEARFEHFADRFDSEEVPRPHSWGGYLIVPERIEFWQGRPNRMHERLAYTRSANRWSVTRLQP